MPEGIGHNSGRRVPTEMMQPDEDDDVASLAQETDTMRKGETWRRTSRAPGALPVRREVQVHTAAVANIGRIGCDDVSQTTGAAAGAPPKQGRLFSPPPPPTLPPPILHCVGERLPSPPFAQSKHLHLASYRPQPTLPPDRACLSASLAFLPCTTSIAPPEFS